MAGKIPKHFIDELMMRVDIVDVIDRRTPLTRKGKEYQACCPFHDEKTPSFTVSPSKQFYHCFGCGAHGTAIGFLMDYANLGFVEAVEELAEGAGLQVPTEVSHTPVATGSDSPGQLLKIVEEASYWFQKQLKSHPDSGQAISYLKGRGLDGRTAARFGLGFAPESWDNLVNALGTDDFRKKQLIKAGLVSQRDSTQSGKEGIYDRFRSRVMFPIEDHRGRIVAFGGRILGDGEPKYLNSPETALFHKGSELYGLHRARRAIGQENRSIVVEGYMDVISLAQFGVDNSVATLGTATSRTHLQRLFRLAPEIIFCFDGDRAGRDAAWKAMQVALPEISDGRQVGFLFLPDGEDPDTVIRAKGKGYFDQQVAKAMSFPDFLFDTLISQVDMSRMDGKARLVSLARPLINQLPKGSLREMMITRMTSLSGLNEQQLGITETQLTQPTRRRNANAAKFEQGTLSNTASVISLVLQYPELVNQLDETVSLDLLTIQGADVLREIVTQCQSSSEQTTGRILELFRDSSIHPYLEKLASHPHSIHSEALEKQFIDMVEGLFYQQDEERRLYLLEKSRQSDLEEVEKEELVNLLNARNKTFIRE